MAARSDDSMQDFDSGNSKNRVEIRFVDEDDLPLAHVMEHRASEEEFYSGESQYSEENSWGSADNSDEEMDDAEEGWSEEIRHRPDINFDNDACGINVDTGNLTSCLDFFELFFYTRGMAVVSYPDQPICRTEEGAGRKFCMVPSYWKWDESLT